MLLPLSLLLSLPLTLAQRPTNTSACDYYAQRAFLDTRGSGTQLVYRIVAVAFAGFDGERAATSGILNEHVFQNVSVNLTPWFEKGGWLDAGGKVRWTHFLMKKGPTPAMDLESKQYRLYTHFVHAFALMLDCSDPDVLPPTLSSATAPQACSSNYTNLSNAERGYMIDQFIQASKYFGFSDEDGQNLSNNLGPQSHFECTPATLENGADQEQLLGLCRVGTCPAATSKTISAPEKRSTKPLTRSVSAYPRDEARPSFIQFLPHRTSRHSGTSKPLIVGLSIGLAFVVIPPLIFAFGVLARVCYIPRRHAKQAAAAPYVNPPPYVPTDNITGTSMAETGTLHRQHFSQFSQGARSSRQSAGVSGDVEHGVVDVAAHDPK